MEKNEVIDSGLKTGLTPAQQQETVLGLLTENKAGHVDNKILYSRYDTLAPKNNGVQAFLDFSHTEAYYNTIVQAEKKLFTTHGSAIKKAMGNHFRDIVELGPGNEKFTHFMHALGYTPEQMTALRYLPADIAKAATDAGKEEAKALNIATGNAINEDWITADFSHVTDGLYLCFGGGLCNNDIAAVIKNLPSGNMLHGGTVVATYFTFPDPTSPDYADAVLRLKAMYGDGNKDNPYRSADSYLAAKHMILKPFEALGFPVACLDLDVQWQEGDPAKIVYGAKVIAPFSLKVGDTTYHKSIGEVMPLIDSPRPRREAMESMIRRGGAVPKAAFTDGEIGLTIAQLPKKPLPRRIKNTVLYGSMVASILTGGTKLGSYLEQQEQKEKQEKVFEETFYHEQSTTKDLTGVLSYNTQEAKKMVYTLEHRYGNTLNDEQKNTIQAMFFDRIKVHPEYIEHPYGGAGGTMRGDNLYQPSLTTRFVRELRNTLVTLGVSVTPNASLTQYTEALSNTYNYQGPTIPFKQVDIQLPDHISEVVGTRENGTFDHFSHPAGIVQYQGKPYMVFKIGEKLDTWSLTQKDSELRDFGVDVSTYAIDIIQHGEITLLAEKIRLYLNKHYGKMEYALNGQGAIAKYLTDLAAQGYDFSYLLAESGKKDRYTDIPNILEVFIMGIVVPDIYQELTEGTLAMHELNTEKVCQTMEKYASVRTCKNAIETFLFQYVGTVHSTSGNIHSSILQLLLADRAREFLQNEQDIRCWLTEHAQTINSQTGIGIPAFPSHLEAYLTNGQYHPEDTLTGLSPGDISGYSMMPFQGGYHTVGGDKIDIGMYSPNGFTNNRLVGRKANAMVHEQIRNDYTAGKLGKATMNNMHGGNYVLQDKAQIIAHFLDKIPFASAPVQEMMDDYTLRKRAMEQYNNKKKR